MQFIPPPRPDAASPGSPRDLESKAKARATEYLRKRGAPVIAGLDLRQILEAVLHYAEQDAPSTVDTERHVSAPDRPTLYSPDQEEGQP